jgi:hypothetical protein
MPNATINIPRIENVKSVDQFRTMKRDMPVATAISRGILCVFSVRNDPARHMIGTPRIPGNEIVSIFVIFAI